MKKTIQGHLFNRIEKLGKEKFNHLGFEKDGQSFGDILSEFVPKVGTKVKVKLTIETIKK